MRNKKKIILPPQLPPDISEDEIEVSDEDKAFVSENKDYAGFLSTLDTTSITKHVTRVADVKEDTLEALYEQRRKKSSQKEKEGSGIEVDPVDALPIKDSSGNLHYLKAPKNSKPPENDLEEPGQDDEDDAVDKGIVKLTKAERRAKLKKLKKEAKKHGKDSATPEVEVQVEVEPTPQAAVLDEVKKDLTAEEGFESKKHKLAELGIALLADPEANIKSLKDMLQICKDKDYAIVKLGLLSLLAVFKDLIPGYRIRLPTEKELEMKVSKDVKKMRLYESTLLNTYKAYLQRLAALEKQPSFQHVAFRCICTLLDAVPYFNFREDLLGIVIKNISSSDDVVRKLCCSTVRSLFTNEGKHGGEATVEAVRLIANYVKARNCQLHPDSIEVFLSLSFYEDLGRAAKEDDKNKSKNKRGKKRKDHEDPRQKKENDKKRSRQEQLLKTREEVAADYKAVAYTPDVMERRRMQTETLSAVFETYFRILKHTMQSSAVRSEANLGVSTGASEPYPLLAPCLQGLGKFSHLIDLDFMGDLINSLRKLASGGGDTDRSSKCLTVSERLRCCIVAFRVMKSNLDALNVDLQDFFVQLYNIILEYRPGRDQGEVLAEALKIMLCEDRQHDMQKAAAFVKRLATFSLCFGSAESMAALVTLKHLLLKNVKCRNLLENDAGGGSVSGLIAKYHPEASDPNLSGALASVLWELNLLSKHYHPGVSSMVSSISSMNTAHSNQVYLSTITPQQAFLDFSLEKPGSFKFQGDIRKSNNKRKRGTGSSISTGMEPSEYTTSIDEDEVKKKLSAHFMVLRDIKENQRLRAELQSTTSSIELYDGYKKQKKKAKKPQTKKIKILTQ
ncbi:PREDICTED: nucleolar complex protein 3 homolog [Fragaria vesca subsp. vesca]|uniref:nucleolar complex protein 3 homolog n=1 Tax=Fragaria vesca subsp. vesca TaxID=101020 RepID=UPI0002C31DF0|nr:PREDICTED: nucleolar complex protein 3 homolog [Fragaria vesca subsp. vesca]